MMFYDYQKFIGKQKKGGEAKMKNFLNQLFSSNDDVSHKRFISIASFIVLLLMVIGVFLNFAVNEHLIYVFAALTGGQSILTVIDKITKK